MAQDVLCEVSSCVHWADSNRCAAEKIYIVKNAEAVKTSTETDCRTFEAK